jgi:hypothetical protein
MNLIDLLALAPFYFRTLVERVFPSLMESGACVPCVCVCVCVCVYAPCVCVCMCLCVCVCAFRVCVLSCFGVVVVVVVVVVVSDDGGVFSRGHWSRPSSLPINGKPNQNTHILK